MQRQSGDSSRVFLKLNVEIRAKTSNDDHIKNWLWLKEGGNMNWQHFQTHNEAPTQAFESMCNQLFDLWCEKTYPDSLKTVTIVNGSGGDGGVESFARLKNGTIFP